MTSSKHVGFLGCSAGFRLGFCTLGAVYLPCGYMDPSGIRPQLGSACLISGSKHPKQNHKHPYAEVACCFNCGRRSCLFKAYSCGLCSLVQSVVLSAVSSIYRQLQGLTSSNLASCFALESCASLYGPFSLSALSLEPVSSQKFL